MALQVDLDDRYDRLTDFQFFNITWCLWDYSDFSCVVSSPFLTIYELSAVCCTTFCISIDFADILEELRRYRHHLENHGQ